MNRLLLRNAPGKFEYSVSVDLVLSARSSPESLRFTEVENFRIDWTNAQISF